MAAVQATPTPDHADEPTTSNKFIESMEDELRRVQEHLDRRNRHRSSISSLTRNGPMGEVSPLESRRELAPAGGGSPLHSRGSATMRPGWYSSSSASPRTSHDADSHSPNSSLGRPSFDDENSPLMLEHKYATFPLRAVRVGSAPPAGRAMPIVVDSDEEDDEDEEEEDGEEEQEVEEMRWKTPVIVVQDELGRSGEHQRVVERSAVKEHKLAEVEQQCLHQQQLIEKLEKKLKEKEQEMKDIRVQYARELRSKEEKMKKLTKDNNRIEKEKWELLKRAREAAERSVNLRTKLDLHESTLRTSQGELERASDELAAVKSANTSLRLLVNELRAPKDKMHAAVQTDAIASPATSARGRVWSQVSSTGYSTGLSSLQAIPAERLCSTPDELVSLDSESRGGTPVALSQPTGQGFADQQRMTRPNLLSRFKKSGGHNSNRHSTSTIGKPDQAFCVI